MLAVYRQGDIGVNWYAVLSGSLDMNVSETGDPKVRPFTAIERGNHLRLPTVQLLQLCSFLVVLLENHLPVYQTFVSSSFRPCKSDKESYLGFPYHLVCCPSLQIIYTIILLKSVCMSVGVLKLQVAILARSSREMSLTVRIV